MGAINPEDIKEFLAALREVLEELQIKVI